ncbi:alpha/beta hydrolase [Rhodococcoides fascians]|uniref:alpha/beta hydrolase n=1 Tax=Rhodococcoides fascians TaxID=1828 RepID=UPI001EE3A1A9|nr:alpha/beta hydrolase [Rhodococcus fascians]
MLPGAHGPVPVRIYRPGSPIGPAPVIVWLHGGGWMIGSVDTGDPVSRALCNRVGAVVVSVDYRLAPEHPWPAGLNDALDTLKWVFENIGIYGGDRNRVIIGGDSAGGNMAAVLAQDAIRNGIPLVAQLLIYPAVDLDVGRIDRYPSVQHNDSGYVLTPEAMAMSFATYVPESVDPAEPRVSPIRAHDLSSLPPAVIAVAEFDPMRDQGLAYAQAMGEAGVPTTVHNGAGLIHGVFDMIGTVPAADREFSKIATSVRAVVDGSADSAMHSTTVAT